MTDEKNLSTFEEGSEDFAAMFAAQEAGTVRLQPGQKVTGTIITITGLCGCGHQAGWYHGPQGHPRCRRQRKRCPR